MEAIVGIAFVWAAAYAITRGTQSAGNAIKGAYRKRVSSWAKRHPASPTPAGVKLGAGLATGVTGAVLAARGFFGGVKVGWPEGKARGEAWWQRRAERRVGGGWQSLPDASTAAVPHRESRPATGASADAPVPVPRKAVPVASAGPVSGDWSRPVIVGGTDTKAETGRRLRPVPNDAAAESAHPNHVPAAGGTATTTPGGSNPMAIVTSTGGEVHTMQQLTAELKGIIEEAGADLEDAQADRKRAQEDASRIEVMVASLQALDLDRQTLGEVSALADTASQRKAASEQRAAAAEARHAQAQTALKGVQDRHSVMAEAHAATPHAANKEFYAN
jgi:hypothetical protein